MGVEKNSASSVDREENELFSSGGSETQKITRSNNPPIKVALFWPRYGGERVTGAGQYDWASCRTQEAGKTMDALAVQYQGSYRPTIGSPKRNSAR
jgi:hypothetical protein